MKKIERTLIVITLAFILSLGLFATPGCQKDVDPPKDEDSMTTSDPI